MSWGSFWRSPSMVISTSPRAWSMPAAMAAVCPALRRNLTSRRSGFVRGSSRQRSKSDPCCHHRRTRFRSGAPAAAPRADGLVQEPDIVLLVVERDDDGQITAHRGSLGSRHSVESHIVVALSRRPNSASGSMGSNRCKPHTRSASHARPTNFSSMGNHRPVVQLAGATGSRRTTIHSADKAKKPTGRTGPAFRSPVVT